MFNRLLEGGEGEGDEVGTIFLVYTAVIFSVWIK
jgi:hypothetical protein